MVATFFSDIVAKYQKKNGRNVNAVTRQVSFGSPTDNGIQPGYPITSVPIGYPSPQNATVGTPYSNHVFAHASAPMFVQGANTSGHNWNIPPTIDRSIYDSIKNDSRHFGSMIPNAQRSSSFRGDDIEMNEVSTSCDSIGPMLRSETGPLSFIEGLMRGENQIHSLTGESEFGSLAPGPPVHMYRSMGGFFGTPKTEPGLAENDEPDVQENNPSMDEETRRKVEEWLVNVKPGDPDEHKQLLNHARASTSSRRPASTSGKHKLSQSSVEENGGPSKKFNSSRDVKRSKTSSKAYVHIGKQGLVRNHENLEPLHEHGRNTPHSTGHYCDPSPATERLQSIESEQYNSQMVFHSDPTTAKPTCKPHPSRRSKHNSWPESKTELLLRKKTERQQQPNYGVAQQVQVTHPKVVQTQNEHLQNGSRSNPQSPASIVVNQGQNEDVGIQQHTDIFDVDQMLSQLKAMSVSMPNGMKPATHNEGEYYP